MIDMLDVIHVLFEEDQVVEEEVEKARSGLRAALYTRLYGHEDYAWAKSGQANYTQPTFGTSDLVAPTTQMQKPTYTPQSEKPPMPDEVRHYQYIPPTKFDPTAAKPFGDVLDAPLG